MFMNIQTPFFKHSIVTIPYNKAQSLLQVAHIRLLLFVHLLVTHFLSIQYRKTVLRLISFLY